MKKTHITNLYGMAGDSTVLLAQNAVQKIAAELGYRELGIYFYNVESDTPLERQKRMDGIIASISFGDIVVFQSPTWNGIVYDREFMDKLCGLNCKIVLFIHDVVPLMFDSNYYLMAEYMGIYNRADVVIVPSEQMKERLVAEGLTVSTILVQKMWDHPHQMSLHAPQFRKEIFFAGSLDRFPDLQHWTYSTPLRVFSDTGHEFAHDTLHIEGWRKDEELLLELSKGGFGLVWGTHENEGENNNYYHMNISYKVSTYLAAGIPVLIPSYLSNAEMIVEHGWGLVVDSLEEAHHIVDTMSAENYQAMCQKVESLSYLLKEGYFSKKLLVDAVFQLGMK